MKKCGFFTRVFVFLMAALILVSGDFISEQGTAPVFAAERYTSHETDGLMKIPTGLRDHHSFIVMDAHSGKLLMADRPDEIVYPASTTKLMTAMVILDNSKPSDVVTVTEAMLKYAPYDLYKYGMKPGEKYTMDTLLNMTLINSSGDAAICAGIGACGSMDSFLKKMNRKCESLGLVYTRFDNPAGLDIGNDFFENYTTAYEMAVITRYAMSYPEIREVVAKKKYRVKKADGSKGNLITSSNLFYSSVKYPKKLYRIIGSKTGSTNAAGHVFAATALDKAGHEIICVYNGKGPMKETFEDIERILTTVYKAINNNEIKTGTQKARISVPEEEYSFTGSYGHKFSLRAELLDGVTGKNITDPRLFKLSYSSSDTDVAYVDVNGVVTVKNPGTAVITIRLKSNSYYKSVKKKIRINIKSSQ